MPVLALAGEHDEAAPPELSELIATATGGTVQVLPGAAHLPPAEQPAATAHEITDFLRGRVADGRDS
jgi:pimeloyl-ACP methyl ester carboxylesterase